MPASLVLARCAVNPSGGKLEIDPMIAEYLSATEAPTRGEIDRTSGPLLLEFGTDWCGFCQAAAPQVSALLREHPGIRHVKVEDGPGRPLGRSFRVKLWPNLVFLRDGVVVRQLARPSASELREAFAAMGGTQRPAGKG